MISINTAMDFDKVIQNADLEAFYQKRVNKLAENLNSTGTDFIVFEDSEDKRDPAIRYFCGHPSDAVLIISKNAECFLFPWDENLAKEKASKKAQIISYTKYNRNSVKAVSSFLENFNNPTVELPPATTYPNFLKFKEAMISSNLICQENKNHFFASRMQSTKDEYEIACTRKACSIGNYIMEEIIRSRKNKSLSELDVAMMIDTLARKNNCEGLGFGTLAAGPERSAHIHAFPGYTNRQFWTKGLSILDFGVIINGYTSDMTCTFVEGPLSKKQETMIQLVQEAAHKSKEFYKPGLKCRNAHEEAQKVFRNRGFEMPHGLGHGIGLEIHQWPFASGRALDSDVFQAGNIVTLEPGLYAEGEGGVRWENDILIAEDGCTSITNSKIAYL